MSAARVSSRALVAGMVTSAAALPVLAAACAAPAARSDTPVAGSSSAPARPVASAPRAPGLSWESAADAAAPVAPPPPQGTCTDPNDWARFTVEQVKTCPEDPSKHPVFGVRVALENRGDERLNTNHSLHLVDARGEKRKTGWPSGECEYDGWPLGMAGKTIEHHWLFFEGTATPDLRLQLPLDEPHGFDEWVADVSIDPHANHCVSPLPVAAPPPPERGVAPPVTRRWFRVTATAMKLCNGGRAFADGQVLLGVEVLFENFARRELDTPHTASVKDASGYVFDSVITQQEDCGPRADPGHHVAPGDKYRSWIWGISVRPDSKRLHLLYRVKGGLLGTGEVVDIPLGDVPKK